MLDTGWKPCSVVSPGSWTSASSIKTLDGNSAWQNIGPGTTTNAIVCTGFDFSAIPSGSTIAGIEFRLTTQSNQTATYNLQPYSGGAAVGTAESKSVASSLQTTTFGGISSLFSWLATDSLVKNSGFGVSITATSGASSPFIFLDFIEARITYAAAAPTVTSNSASGTAGVGGTVQMSATESPTSWSLTGSPPTGVSINSSGLVTWTTATPAAVHSITVRATNATGNGDGTLTLTINASSLAKLGGAIHMIRRGR